MFNMKMILQEDMEKEIQTLTGEVLDLKDAVEKLEKASDNK